VCVSFCISEGSEINNKSLWGSYSIPKDNPYADEGDLGPEIWALGLRNPWRCSFDSKRPSYFYCGDVGQVLFKIINLPSFRN
jgi:glucose/arabinose dehydrogenase